MVDSLAAYTTVFCMTQIKLCTYVHMHTAIAVVTSITAHLIVHMYVGDSGHTDIKADEVE